MDFDKQQIGKRLKKFAEEHFSSLSELAEKIGMKPQALQVYLHGKSVPGGEILSRLSSLGCDINWLLAGEYDGSIFSDVIDAKHIPEKKEFLIAGTIPAGIAHFQQWSDLHETEPIDYDPDAYFFIKVDEEFGYSMMPTVLPGDLVLVSLYEPPRNGDLVAALWDGTRGGLKIYNEHPLQPDSAVLSSYNQAVQPIFVDRKTARIYRVVLIKKKGSVNPAKAIRSKETMPKTSSFSRGKQ